MKYYSLLIIAFQIQIGYSQEMTMRPLSELINEQESGWELVQNWISNAKNDIQILPRNKKHANKALYRTQVTTRSPMGAIIYNTGGILVDNGWIRILGSGSKILKRNLPEWNKGKTFEKYGEAMPILLVADDAIGGFFALNGGGFGNIDLGKVYYFSPDTLEWEPLNIGYSELLKWAFTGALGEFYEGLRWNKWKNEVKIMSADSAVHFFPYLWTKYEDIELLSRKAVPIEEIWFLQKDISIQLIEKE